MSGPSKAHLKDVREFNETAAPANQLRTDGIILASGENIPSDLKAIVHPFAVGHSTLMGDMSALEALRKEQPDSVSEESLLKNRAIDQLLKFSASNQYKNHPARFHPHLSVRPANQKITSAQYQSMTTFLMEAKTPDACRMAFRTRAMIFLSYGLASRGDDVRRVLLAELGMKVLDNLGVGKDGHRGTKVSFIVFAKFMLKCLGIGTSVVPREQRDQGVSG